MYIQPDQIIAIVGFLFTAFTFYPFIASGFFGRKYNGALSKYVDNQLAMCYVFPMVGFVLLVAVSLAITAFWAEGRGDFDDLASSTLYFTIIGFYAGNVVTVAYWVTALFFSSNGHMGYVYLVLSTIAAIVVAVGTTIVAARAEKPDGSSYTWLWFSAIAFIVYALVSIIMCFLLYKTMWCNFTCKKSKKSHKKSHKKDCPDDDCDVFQPLVKKGNRSH